MEKTETTKEQELNILIANIGESVVNTAPPDSTLAQHRKDIVLDFIGRRLPHYVEVLGMDALTILSAWEKNRDSLIEVNFYQDYMLPELEGTFIFETKEEFNTKFPSHKAICPNCKGETTDYYKCNSGKVVSGKTCDWISNPAMGISPDYIRVIIKELFADFPVPQQIFKPIELAPSLDLSSQPAIKKMI